MSRLSAPRAAALLQRYAGRPGPGVVAGTDQAVRLSPARSNVDLMRPGSRHRRPPRGCMGTIHRSGNHLAVAESPEGYGRR